VKLGRQKQRVLKKSCTLFLKGDNKRNNHHQPIDSGQPSNFFAVLHKRVPDLDKEKGLKAVSLKEKKIKDSWAANPGPKMYIDFVNFIIIFEFLDHASP